MSTRYFLITILRSRRRSTLCFVDVCNRSNIAVVVACTKVNKKHNTIEKFVASREQKVPTTRHSKILAHTGSLATISIDISAIIEQDDELK